MSFLDLIKQAGVGAVEAGKPVAIMFGSVVSTDPLEILVDQRLLLTGDFLLIPERMTEYLIDASHTHGYQDQSGSGTATRTTEPALPEPLVIRRGLEVDDKLLLLRMQGGQQFVVLDRLVTP